MENVDKIKLIAGVIKENLQIIAMNLETVEVIKACLNWQFNGEKQSITKFFFNIKNDKHKELRYNNHI